MCHSVGAGDSREKAAQGCSRCAWLREGRAGIEQEASGERSCAFLRGIPGHPNNGRDSGEPTDSRDIEPDHALDLRWPLHRRQAATGHGQGWLVPRDFQWTFNGLSMDFQGSFPRQRSQPSCCPGWQFPRKRRAPITAVQMQSPVRASTRRPPARRPPRGPHRPSRMQQGCK